MIAGVLRLLDVLMGLREPVAKELPPQPADFTSLSDENLRQLYLEVGAEMRALRATEFSVAGLFYAVAAFLLSASLGLLVAEGITHLLKVACILAVIAFLLRFWFAVHSRIAHDNASYAYLMGCRRFIEKRWFWEGMPGKPANIGDGAGGRGYRMTQELVALASLAVSGILLLALLFSTNWRALCSEDKPAATPIIVNASSAAAVTTPPASTVASATSAASAASD